MGRKKKETAEEAYLRGKTELADSIVSLVDEFLNEQRKTRDFYPRNTKFIDIQIDTIEELKEKLIYNLGDNLPQYVVQRQKMR